MKKEWNTTYERWTEADTEAGETNDKGFSLENVTIREAIEDVGGVNASYSANEYPVTGNVRWLTNNSYNEGTHEYFTTGIEEQRSLHIPDHITPSSRLRLARLLGVVTIYE
jgi:hypothetical protein